MAVEWAKDSAFEIWQLPLPAKDRPAPAEATSHSVGNIRIAVTKVVLWDNERRSHRGLAKWYEHCLTPLEAEAMVCGDGLQYARVRGIEKLELKTDCQVLVNL